MIPTVATLEEAMATAEEAAVMPPVDVTVKTARMATTAMVGQALVQTFQEFRSKVTR